MDDLKMDVTKVNLESVLGEAIHTYGDTKDVREMIYDQMKDNFCATLAIIGYYNMNVIRPGLLDKVNAFVNSIVE